MNERIKELMVECDYAAPELAGRATKLVDLIVKECLVAVENTDRRHALTTFDAALIEATIERTVKSVKQHFGVK